MRLQCELTCPSCGNVTSETMPTDFCLWRYDCAACGAVLTPKDGDCCVFCSYGDTPCPPIQDQTDASLPPTACCSSSALSR